MSTDTTVPPPVADADREAFLLRAAQERATEPRAYWARLRQQGPVDFDEYVEGAQVVRRGDVESVLRDTDLWTNEMGIMGSEEPVIPLGVDPPQHSMYRRLLDPLFSPRRMAALEPSVTAHVNRIIDSFIDEGAVDFSTELAVPLPCLTFLSLLGLPTDELDDLVRWKDIMIRPEVVAGSREAGHELQARTAGEIYARFGQEIAERRERPRDDLMTFLTTAEVEGGRRLTDSEILRTLFLLLAAGLDTVTISLECIFHYLAEHPEARQMLVDDPGTTDGLIEELLRWETPVINCSVRIAKRDTELSGTPIPKGTKVVPSIAAANYDPDFPGSQEVDLRRNDKSHLSFGGGPHRCLGSHLARMELRVVVREWHRRIQDYGLEPGAQIDWVPSSLRGIEHLPLVWHTTGRTAE
jgi:cytochrome P450